MKALTGKSFQLGSFRCRDIPKLLFPYLADDSIFDRSVKIYYCTLFAQFTLTPLPFSPHTTGLWMNYYCSGVMGVGVQMLQRLRGAKDFYVQQPYLLSRKSMSIQLYIRSYTMFYLSGELKGRRRILWLYVPFLLLKVMYHVSYVNTNMLSIYIVICSM